MLLAAGTADRADDSEHAVLWRLSPALAPDSVHAVDLGTFGGNGSEGNGIQLWSLGSLTHSLLIRLPPLSLARPRTDSCGLDASMI